MSIGPVRFLGFLRRRGLREAEGAASSTNNGCKSNGLEAGTQERQKAGTKERHTKEKYFLEEL
jgi:hypothetical protein